MRKNRGTLRSKRSNKSTNFEQEIVVKFLVLLHTVKLHHWKTHTYSVHMATDTLYDELSGNIDKFVEVLLGKTGNRVNLTNVKSIPLYDYTSAGQLKNKMLEYKSYLVGLDNNAFMKTMSNSDLYNIRDEILSNLNQFLYRLTLQ